MNTHTYAVNVCKLRTTQYNNKHTYTHAFSYWCRDRACNDCAFPACSPSLSRRGSRDHNISPIPAAAHANKQENYR